jgi:hypothetical protein
MAIAQALSEDAQQKMEVSKVMGVPQNHPICWPLYVWLANKIRAMYISLRKFILASGCKWFYDPTWGYSILN